MSIGKRISALRKSAKLTQDQLGEICGISKGAVSQWESDTTVPSTESLLMMARKLTFSLDWLLLGVGADQYESGHTSTILKVREPSAYERELQQNIDAMSDRGIIVLIEKAEEISKKYPKEQTKAA